MLTRDSAQIPRGRAALGLLRGGGEAQEVARAVRLSGARVVHAHNLLPALGWRALAAARRGGARVVLHLHQYRLVCAVGVCFTAGEECTRCHGRNTLPGVAPNCRGSRPRRSPTAPRSRSGSGGSSALADAVVIPSEFAGERLRELGAPLRGTRAACCRRPWRPLAASAGGRGRGAATRWSSRGWRPRRASTSRSRRAGSRGCRSSIAGDGPGARRGCAARRGGAEVRFVGRVERRRARGAAGGGRDRARRRPARPRRSGSPPPRRWPPGCRWPPAASARCPSSSSRTASCGPGTPAPWPRRSRDGPATRPRGSAARRASRALCSPEVVAEALARLRPRRRAPPSA